MTIALPRLSAEDRLDIMELFARYSWAIDLADAPAAVACFAEDGYFDHLWQGRVQGHAAIQKNLEELWYGRGAWWYGRQHLFNHFRFHPESQDRVRVQTFFQIIQFNVEYNNNFVFGIGTRDDLVVRRNGTWVFQTLCVNAWRKKEDVPWRGSLAVVARPGAPEAVPTAPPEFTASTDDKS
jgi:SnoaL-like domain